MSSFRLLWGCNPAKWDTDTLYAPGLFRTLRQVVVDPSGGYLPGGATWDSGAIGFSSGSPATTFGPDELFGSYDYAAKWPRFVPDGLHWTWGDRFWMDANPAAITPIALILNQEGFCNLSLCIDTSGHLCVWRGLPDVSHGLHVELWNSGVPLATGEWHRLGFWGLLASVNGWFDVYHNSTQLVFASGLVTHVHGIIQWTGMGWGGTADMKHSHLYMGSGRPDPESRIRRGGFLSIPGMPVADGAYSGGTSSEATLYEAIDEAPPDDVTSTIELGAVGQTFTVQREELDGTRAILGVQRTMRYNREADSAYALRQVIAVNDVVYTASTLAADAAGDWAFDQVLALVDPSNGLPYTRARLNSITEYGALVHGPAA